MATRCCECVVKHGCAESGVRWAGTKVHAGLNRSDAGLNRSDPALDVIIFFRPKQAGSVDERG